LSSPNLFQLSLEPSGTFFDCIYLEINMLPYYSIKLSYSPTVISISSTYLPIDVSTTSLRSLNITIQAVPIFCFSESINYIPEGFFSTVALRRYPSQNEKCPSLLGFRALYCSERGDRTLDLRVMNPTLLPSELPRQIITFLLKVCKGNHLTFPLFSLIPLFVVNFLRIPDK
jgi:hypothetical protein